MLAPAIGITVYGPDGELPTYSLPRVYVDAVAAAGGVPILIAPSSCDLGEVFDRVDGVILAGGGDIDPASYGGPGHETVYMTSGARDDFEVGIARAALAQSTKPLLGICRGMQVMNIACGGDLDVHLPEVYGDAISHRLPPRVPTEHPVELDAGTRLAGIYGTRHFSVCSWHHQAVRKIGEGLEVAGRAADGVVEALECSDHPWALGVQWHPEMQVPDDAIQRRLFDAFVARAASAR